MATDESTAALPAIVPDDRLISYFRAGYPLLYMLTAEEGRAEQQIMASAFAKDPVTGKPVTQKEALWVWSCTDGLSCVTDKDTKPPVSMGDAAKALGWVKSEVKSRQRTIWIFRDLHQFMAGGAGAVVIRLLRDLAKELQGVQSVLIILSPVAKIPLDLNRDIVQIDYNLPDRAQVDVILSRLLKSNAATILKKGLVIDDDERERIVSAALGLTGIEAMNAFSMAIVDGASGKGKIADLVLKEKAIAVKKGGILEYFEPNENIDSIGGLENLKIWLKKRARAFSKKARDYGLPMPKGGLFVGIPGGGKSLASKAAAVIMRVPLIRFDIARVFAGLVGQSEENMRTALQTIDAVGPCVVWVDEIEKAFAGASNSGGGGDSGVTRRVFGNFLTWMQEKTTPSFVIATANSVIGIPPEMLRKGRFDENFFIDAPGPLARAEICKIQLRKRGRENVGINIGQLVAASDNGHTGAEIEAAITEGLFTAFDHERELQTEDVILALRATNPIAVACKDELRAMMEWAKENAINASKPDEEPGKGNTAAGRQLVL